MSFLDNKKDDFFAGIIVTSFTCYFLTIRAIFKPFKITILLWEW